MRQNIKNVTTSDDGTVVPDIAAGNEAVADSHVVALDAAIVEQNIAILDAVIA